MRDLTTRSTRSTGSIVPTTDDGIVVVDKPAGWTSHDVVAKVRRLAGTRRVGHAGTLDPMATGVLVLGIGRGTRLLGHLALTRKVYQATARLGAATSTDDADGETTACTPAGHLDLDAVRTSAASLVGAVDQVPSAVSAVKVAGERAYARVRRGEQVQLAARPVTVHSLEVRDLRRGADHVDVDLVVECSSGTYVRALARDLGNALGVGGHLTALRRTAVGPFTLGAARTLSQLAEHGVQPMGLGEAAGVVYPTAVLGVEDERAVSHGRALRPGPPGPDGMVALLGSDGRLLGLYTRSQGEAHPLAVFAAA